MKLSRKELWARTDRLFSLLESCRLCPRHCGVNRLKGELGFCKTGDQAMISSYGQHFGEEAPLVGKRGSGTVFFSWCNLNCIYCQNYEISQLGEGHLVRPEMITFIFLALKDAGCHNINLVTPTHVVPFWVKALALLEEGGGLGIPVVYNTGGYDNVEVLELLEGIVDIYMPDFKYWDKDVGKRLSKCENYPEVARRALREMHRQVGDLEIGPDGIAKAGLLVRHLVLPGGLSGASQVFRFISEEISRDTYINIMDQYRPCGPGPLPPPLDRRITREEYEAALKEAKRVGLWRIDGMI